jgi:hypothetical protein
MAMSKAITHLRDLMPDPRNARKHNPRNVGMIETALNEVGAARSIVIDEVGVVLAGNATIEAAAQAGIERVQVVEADGDTIIAVQRRGLTPEQKTKLALYDNRTAELGDWDAAMLAELAQEVDLSAVFREDELSALLEAAGTNILEEQERTIKGHSDGYDFREIHSGKLAYRVEAAWRAQGQLAIDLYSGQGQLAQWYMRRFDRVLRVDHEAHDGVDFVMNAATWLQSSHFLVVAQDFDFIDFDDAGSPLQDVCTFFSVLPPRNRPFVLCVTDGSGLNLKLHGQFNPALYGMQGAIRRATNKDYDQFEDLVYAAVVRAAASGGYTAQQWSSVRGSEGNVVYQTFEVRRA